MLNLLRNENMKIYRRIRTWIMFGLLLAFVVLVSSVMAYYAPDPSEEQWRENVQAGVTNAKQQLEVGGLPDLAVDQFERTVKIGEYRLANDIPPENVSMWGAAKDVVTGLLTLATIFVLIIAGDTVAGEFSTGTVKLWMIRPISRSKLLLSKYISTLLFALAMVAFLFVAAVLVVGVLYGFEGAGVPHLYVDGDGNVQEISMFVNIWQTIGLKSFELIMVVTLAFMISTIFRSSAFAIGLSIFTLLASYIFVGVLASQFEWMKYYLFTNVDLTQYIEGMPFVEGTTMGFSLAVIAVYFVVMNAVSWLVFNKRDIAV